MADEIHPRGDNGWRSIHHIGQLLVDASGGGGLYK
jgi:hypothetical protein